MRELTFATELVEAINGDEPVVFHGTLASIPDWQGLAFESLVEGNRDRLFPLSETLDGVSLVCVARPKHVVAPPCNLPLSELLERPLYLEQKSAENLGERAAEAASAVWDHFGLPVDLKTRNIWVGASGVGAPLHFDNTPNILVMVEGEKQFFWAPPEQLANVSLHSPATWASHLVRSVGKGFQCKSVTLRAGDVLFLPPHWLHATRNLSLGVMLNFWFYYRDTQVQATKILDAGLCHRMALEYDQTYPAFRNHFDLDWVPPFALSQWDIGAFGSVAARAAALLISAKTIQGVVLGAIGPSRPDWSLRGFREHLERNQSLFPETIWKALTALFDDVASIVETQLNGKPIPECDISAAQRASKDIDDYTRELALNQTRDLKVRVGFNELANCIASPRAKG